MKIPLNWLKELVKLPAETKSLTDSLTSVGHMLDKMEIIDGEVILDLELRGNRADCYSILGIAREVSALFGNKTKDLALEKLTIVKNLKNVNLSIKSPYVKRAAMTIVRDVVIMKSPAWLSKRLEKYGIESVNNIVDLTNYVMVETGEPMHAFDLDKLSGNLEIRLAKNGEKITTFQGTSLTLTSDDLVWAQGKNVLSVAGAIGEKSHSVSDTTENILLEAANYDRANIRKSVYRHNLLTEAGIRHEKELDPNMVADALGRYLYLIKKYGWGKIDYKVYDYYPKKYSPITINLNFDHLYNLGGVVIEIARIKKILTGLNMRVMSQDSQSLGVMIPTYRTDIILEEDLIEEVLRIYGYNNIPSHVLSLEIPKNITPKYIIQEENLRQVATAVGFSEAITLSFVKTNLSEFNIHPEIAEAKLISLVNPPSPDNRDLRLTLFPNLFEVARKAIFERSNEVSLFEIGKVYFKEQGGYKESRKIGLMYYEEGGDFTDFKSLLNSFFIKSGVKIPTYSLEAMLIPLSNTYTLTLGGRDIGFGGRHDNLYYAEIILDKILEAPQKYSVSLWPKYPPQIEDLTITFPEKTKIGDVMTAITNLQLPIYNIELKEIYKDAYTFRIWYQDPNKTLTDREVEQIRNKILSVVKTKFGGFIKN